MYTKSTCVQKKKRFKIHILWIMTGTTLKAILAEFQTILKHTQLYLSLPGSTLRPCMISRLRGCTEILSSHINRANMMRATNWLVYACNRQNKTDFIWAQHATGLYCMVNTHILCIDPQWPAVPETDQTWNYCICIYNNIVFIKFACFPQTSKLWIRVSV